MPTKKEATKESAKKESAKAKDTRSYFYAVGKRKTAIAKVKVFPKGKGNYMANEKTLEEYFYNPLIEKVLLPLKTLGMQKDYDIEAVVQGGGIAAQADAVQHGISKALSDSEDTLKTTLKRSGFLSRDARVKERKKYGLKKARRAPQWSKR